jgi:nucleolar protein TMA23
MWWMNAFDKSLKGLDTSKEGKVVQTVTNAGLDMVVKGGARHVGNGGLYASFVRGEPLSGTITPEEPRVENASEEEQPSPKKRRKVVNVKESKEERKARKAAKRALRAQEAATEEETPVERAEDASVKKPETAEERTERKRQKLARKAVPEVDQSWPDSRNKKKRRKA